MVSPPRSALVLVLVLLLLPPGFVAAATSETMGTHTATVTSDSLTASEEVTRDTNTDSEFDWEFRGAQLVPYYTSGTIALHLTLFRYDADVGLFDDRLGVGVSIMDLWGPDPYDRGELRPGTNPTVDDGSAWVYVSGGLSYLLYAKSHTVVYTPFSQTVRYGANVITTTTWWDPGVHDSYERLSPVLSFHLTGSPYGKRDVEGSFTKERLSYLQLEMECRWSWHPMPYSPPSGLMGVVVSLGLVRWWNNNPSPSVVPFRGFQFYAGVGGAWGGFAIREPRTQDK